MDRTTRNDTKPRTSDSRPIDMERWEGEGGHPPAEHYDEGKIPKVTGILRRFLINLKRK